MTSTTAELMHRCRTLAKKDGPARALNDLQTTLGLQSVWGSDGYAVVAASATRPQNTTVAITLPFDSGDLAVWHVSRADTAQQSPDEDGDPVMRVGAAWIRLGLTERLLRLASEYVSGRKAAGTPLSAVSAVRTLIGEVTADLVEAELLLDHDGDSGLPRAMAAVERAVRVSLRLLGASGFLDAEPARLARAADFLGDIYHLRAAEAVTGGHQRAEATQ